MADLRTTYLDLEQTGFGTQLLHALADRQTVLVYGPTARTARLASAVLTFERATGRSVRVTREHDRWVLAR